MSTNRGIERPTGTDGDVVPLHRELAGAAPAPRRIVGYTAGVFDMFHIGHLNLLASARSQCDSLVVGVTTDELALERKNKEPVIPFFERMAIVQGVRHVDRVVPQTSMDKFSAWRELRFDAIFVGDDWRGSDTWNRLESQFSAVGVDVVYFPYTQHTSSTILRKKLLGLD